MKRVLFVDDEQNVLDGLCDRLGKHRSEMDMVFAHGGEAALAELRRGSFDVIVSDLRMPRIDGAMLLRRVKEEHPDITRIIFSVKATGTASSTRCRSRISSSQRPATPII